MIRIWIFISLFFSLTTAESQNLIGKSRTEVETLFKNHYPDFAIDNTTVNHSYKYLKYVDKFNEQTMLVFLSEGDTCTATKLMSSYSNLLQVRKDLNKKYKPAGKNIWRYNEKGKKYLVRLKSEEWYFSVFTSKEK